MTEHVRIAAEWFSIKTHRNSRAYVGLPLDATEDQAQLTLKLRF